MVIVILNEAKRSEESLLAGEILRFTQNDIKPGSDDKDKGSWRQMPKKRLAFAPKILSTDAAGNPDSSFRAFFIGSTNPSACG